MASTRNKNTPGDYALEKKAYELQFKERTFLHGPAGQAITTNHPGNGLLTGRIAAHNLSNNYCDIESSLFGIGSTNLENPLPIVKPDIRNLQSLNVIDKLPLYHPSSFKIKPNQRPMYLN